MNAPAAAPAGAFDCRNAFADTLEALIRFAIAQGTGEAKLQ